MNLYRLQYKDSFDIYGVAQSEESVRSLLENEISTHSEFPNLSKSVIENISVHLVESGDFSIPDKLKENAERGSTPVRAIYAEGPVFLREIQTNVGGPKGIYGYPRD